jgi:hypothetical protein
MVATEIALDTRIYHNQQQIAFAVASAQRPAALMFDRYRDITVVLGTDQRYLRQLETSWPTWRRFQPWLWELPWVLFYDRDMPGREVQRLTQAMQKSKDVRLIAWPPVTPSETIRYESQRHKMLSGFAFVPAMNGIVQTPYWLKIDNDAICTASAEWPQDEWFEDTPAIVASPWGYTKPPDQMNRLDEWGSKIPGLNSFPPLCLPVEPGAGRCRHRRICSWLFFARTEWTKEVATYCGGNGVLPVPSQDGFHWYCAARRGDKVSRVRMKAHGWTNISSLRRLQSAVGRILAD